MPARDKNRTASHVGHSHLAVENGVLLLAIARHEPRQAPETVVFEIEQPIRIVERLFSPGRDDRLHPRQRRRRLRSARACSSSRSSGGISRSKAAAARPVSVSAVRTEWFEAETDAAR